MKLIIFVFISLLFSFCICRRPHVKVLTNTGYVRGYVKGGVQYFKGIPYAQPPVGDLRFKRPFPVTPWNRTLDAFKFGADCPNVNNHWTNNTSEDCLFVNVWAPHNRNGHLPVLVFFYPGSFIDGASSFKLFNGARIVRYHGDVVVVTFNYRLGALGFFASPCLAEEDKHGYTGNYALQDQQLVLKWVRNNIESFGGDSDRVTIFGQSAGGASVMHHLIIPSSRHLFHKAIIDSGGPAAWNYHSLEVGECYTNLTLQALGCTGSSYPSQDAQIECARKAPVADIVAASSNPFLIWAPNVDFKFIPGDPNVLFFRGRFPEVPVIVGTSQNNIPILLPPQACNYTIEDVYGYLVAYYGTTAAQQIFQALPNLYPASSYPTPYSLLVAAAEDAFFRCPLRRIARDVSDEQLPVYAFFHTYTLQSVAEQSPRLGAFHGEELLFLFADRSLNINFSGYNFTVTPQEFEFFTNYYQHWLSNFLHDSAPQVNSESDPNWYPFWPRYYFHKIENVLNVTIPTTVISQEGAIDPYLCDFWDTIQENNSLKNPNAADAWLYVQNYNYSSFKPENFSDYYYNNFDYDDIDGHGHKGHDGHKGNDYHKGHDHHKGHDDQFDRFKNPLTGPDAGIFLKKDKEEEHKIGKNLKTTKENTDETIPESEKKEELPPQNPEQPSQKELVDQVSEESAPIENEESEMLGDDKK